MCNKKQSPFAEWIKTQPKEFVDEISNNKVLLKGCLTLEGLIELDLKFNPEDEND